MLQKLTKYFLILAKTMFMKFFTLSIFLIFFYSCQQKKENLSVESNTNQLQKEKDDFIAKAKTIAMNSQKALGGKLKAKLAEGGPIHALEFCSLQAIPITDSLSDAQEVTIRRVTDKTRNAANIADDKELDYINFVKEQLKNGEIPTPNAQILSDKNVAYFPIITNAMCLQCHGQKGNTLADATYQKIQELYPDDMATGYADEELRGIWVIEMLKNSNGVIVD